MKKLLPFLLFVAFLLMFSVSAAPTETDAANSLYALGLVQGYGSTGDRFGLADNLTRAQAVILLERYLGVEEAAKAETAKAPFDDVPAWADAYVSYAVANNLVAGKKDAAGRVYFDADAAISEPEFLTLMLRAMGYTDKNDGSGDFVWSDPFTLAGKLGMTEHTAASAAFKRGDAFVICIGALTAETKSGKIVADRLMEQNVFTERQYTRAKKIAAGEKITVLCVGDSITQGTGAKNQANNYPNQLQKLLGDGYKVVNCGKASSYVMSPESAYNVKASKPALWYPATAQYATAMRTDADIVIVMLGTNDGRSMSGKGAENDFVADYKTLVSDLQKLPSEPEIYLATMIPAVNDSTSHQSTTTILPEIVRSIATELKLPLIDNAATLADYYTALLPYNDKVHPNDATYAALAINFYREVFDGKTALPTLTPSAGKVVFVSESGAMTNGGTSPADAVKTLAHAISLLPEGGTVVVSGVTEEGITVTPKTNGKVTVTSIYDGVNYAETAGAKLVLAGTFMIGGDLEFRDLHIAYNSNGNGFYCGYNNVTFGDGLTCTRTAKAKVDYTVNAGYAIGLAGLTAADVSAHKDCTITVRSGTYALFRGGNIRQKAEYPVGSVDAGVKLHYVISGGEFTYKGSSVNTGTGMNGCGGDLVFEINGGKFASDVYAVCRIGTNSTADAAKLDGSVTMTITGGEFAGNVGLYQSADAPRAAQGKTVLRLGGDAKSMQGSITGFDRTEIVD